MQLSPGWIIIMIALIDTNQDFLQSSQCAVNCVLHVRSRGQGAIVCKVCATHRALTTCNTTCYVLCGAKGLLSY